jgi:hypothetical protein
MPRHRGVSYADAHSPHVWRVACGVPLAGRTRGRAPGRVFFPLATPIVLLLVFSSLTSEARADDDGACIGAVAVLNKKAIAAYQDLDFDGARQTLEAGLETCGHVASTPRRPLAETHLLLGLVSLAQSSARHDEALSQFGKALEIEPTVTLSARLANPEVQRVFEEAKRMASAAVPTAETDHSHAASDDAPHAASDDGQAGSRRDALPSASSSEDGRPTPDRPRHARKHDHAADAGDVAVGAGGNDRGVARPSFYVGLGLGSGIGWTSGSGEVTDASVPSGFRPSSLGHVVPEVGYFLSRNLLLSLQLRVQFVSGATSERDPNLVMCGSDHLCSPSKGAMALFARAAWFARSTSKVRPYASAMVGAGQVRHLVTIPRATTCGDDPNHPVECVDTVLAGPVFLGPGVGVAMNLAPTFALVLGANSLLGFPRFTFHVDLDAGVALEF